MICRYFSLAGRHGQRIHGIGVDVLRLQGSILLWRWGGGRRHDDTWHGRTTTAMGG